MKMKLKIIRYIKHILLRYYCQTKCKQMKPYTMVLNMIKRLKNMIFPRKSTCGIVDRKLSATLIKATMTMISSKKIIS